MPRIFCPGIVLERRPSICFNLLYIYIYIYTNNCNNIKSPPPVEFQPTCSFSKIWGHIDGLNHLVQIGFQNIAKFAYSLVLNK